MLKSLTAKAGTAVAAAGVLALGLLSASPAFAGRHDWRHEHHGCWNCGPRFGVVVGAPPPVVYAPPPAYYAPPPVVYSPGISFGVNIR